jgi:hypothetical protein
LSGAARLTAGAIIMEQAITVAMAFQLFMFTLLEKDVQSAADGNPVIRSPRHLT